MTCKDCIHFTNELVANKYHRCDAYLSIGGVDGDGWTVLPEYNACKLFECDDETYHDGTYHCPRCGKPVNAWGLCDECDQVYLTHDSVGNALDALDSWESVSK